MLLYGDYNMMVHVELLYCKQGQLLILARLHTTDWSGSVAAGSPPRPPATFHIAGDVTKNSCTNSRVFSGAGSHLQ